MASNSDILSVLQNGVTAVQALAKNTGSVFMGGSVIAVNTVATVGSVVVSSNPNRINITFHNPGSINIYVWPIKDINGNLNIPSFANPGGAFVVMPGAFLTLIDSSNSAWAALSSGGSTNPLTILDQS